MQSIYIYYIFQVSTGGKRKKDEIFVDCLDFNKKILHTAWHPSENIIAVAATNNLFLLQDKFQPGFIQVICLNFTAKNLNHTNQNHKLVRCMAKCNCYFHEKYFSKNVFSPLFADSAHAKHIFTTSYVFVMVKKGAHTHKKNLRILLARKKILSKYTEQKKINLKKEKSRPSEKCFIPFQ